MTNQQQMMEAIDRLRKLAVLCHDEVYSGAPAGPEVRTPGVEACFLVFQMRPDEFALARRAHELLLGDCTETMTSCGYLEDHAIPLLTALKRYAETYDTDQWAFEEGGWQHCGPRGVKGASTPALDAVESPAPVDAVLDDDQPLTPNGTLTVVAASSPPRELGGMIDDALDLSHSGPLVEAQGVVELLVEVLNTSPEYTKATRGGMACAAEGAHRLLGQVTDQLQRLSDRRHLAAQAVTGKEG